MVYPNQCEATKAAAPNLGWDSSLLTFTCPGFDCGSHLLFHLIPLPSRSQVPQRKNPLFRPELHQKNDNMTTKRHKPNLPSASGAIKELTTTKDTPTLTSVSGAIKKLNTARDTPTLPISSICFGCHEKSVKGQTHSSIFIRKQVPKTTHLADSHDESPLPRSNKALLK